jgi:hypothetical protein
LVVKYNIVLQFELYTHNVIIAVEDQCIILYLFWVVWQFLKWYNSSRIVDFERTNDRYVMYHTSIVFLAVAIIQGRNIKASSCDVSKTDETTGLSNVFRTISQRPSHTTSHTTTWIGPGYLYVYMNKCVYLHSRRVHTWYRYVI